MAVVLLPPSCLRSGEVMDCTPLVDLRSHSTRGIAFSTALLRSISLVDISLAVSWLSTLTFVQSYRDMRNNVHEEQCVGTSSGADLEVSLWPVLLASRVSPAETPRQEVRLWDRGQFFFLCLAGFEQCDWVQLGVQLIPKALASGFNQYRSPFKGLAKFAEHTKF